MGTHAVVFKLASCSSFLSSFWYSLNCLELFPCCLSSVTAPAPSGPWEVMGGHIPLRGGPQGRCHWDAQGMLGGYRGLHWQEELPLEQQPRITFGPWSVMVCPGQDGGSSGCFCVLWFCSNQSCRDGPDAMLAACTMCTLGCKSIHASLR